MMITKRNITLLLFSFAFAFPLLAQKKELYSYTYVDSTSYRLYVDKKWDELISFSKKVIKADSIDFYYLRMRIGYAYQIQEKYRLAIKHYQKALLFYDNKYPKEMILLCYEYAGRKSDALLYSKNITKLSNLKLYYKYKKKILSFGLAYNFNYANSTLAKSSLETATYVATDGVQKVSNYYHLPKISLSHKIGRALILTHDFSYLSKNELSYGVTDDAVSTLETQTISQYNYNIAAIFTPFLGFSIIPSYQWLRFEDPSTSTLEYSINKNGQEQTITKTNYETNSFINLRLQKESKLFNWGVSYGQGNLNERNQRQIGFHSTFFPLANLNLYYNVNLFSQYEYTSESHKSTIIQNHLIGSKISDNLWLELSGIFGPFSNFYDAENRAVYNSTEKIKSNYAITAIIPLPKKELQFYIKANIINYETSFYDADNINLDYNNQTFNALNFMGGIVWKF